MYYRSHKLVRGIFFFFYLSSWRTVSSLVCRYWALQGLLSACILAGKRLKLSVSSLSWCMWYACDRSYSKLAIQFEDIRNWDIRVIQAEWRGLQTHFAMRNQAYTKKYQIWSIRDHTSATAFEWIMHNNIRYDETCDCYKSHIYSIYWNTNENTFQNRTSKFKSLLSYQRKTLNVHFWDFLASKYIISTIIFISISNVSEDKTLGKPNVQEWLPKHIILRFCWTTEVVALLVI